jgi:hypothetical protein
VAGFVATFQLARGAHLTAGVTTSAHRTTISYINNAQSTSDTMTFTDTFQ